MGGKLVTPTVIDDEARTRTRREVDMATSSGETTGPSAEDKASVPFEKPSYCLLCGQIGPALLYGHWVCDHCKNVVQAEALAKKRQIIKEGGGPAPGL
jgi:hypothetical protein